ncbi:golgin subfamily A member 6-like protein 22 [Simochromis diagramma]|uniref:golgin subfamily A member 6-like protein 22 n=1 Tax=Simochromis diagramma TaxID=43689 RepID=UPI001A7E24FF|nr:golgin subfamily A member 6-like protein 22 [Simochromis diagramma]
MPPRKGQQRQKEYAARPLCSGRPISPGEIVRPICPGEITTDGVLSVLRALQESQKEKSDLHYKIKQIEEEKLQLEEKCRQLEARNKDLEEKQQRQPDIKMINEGSGVKFGEGREKIFSSGTQSAELKETSAQLQGKKATIEEIQWDLQNTEKQNRVLRGKLNEAEKTIEKIHQQKTEQEIQMQDKLKAMQKLYNDLKVKCGERKRKNKALLEEKKQQEEEKRIIQDFERRHLELQEFCNKKNEETLQLKREKEIRMKDKLKATRKLYNDLIVRFRQIKRKNKELLEERKQQEEEKRIIQDFERRNLELLEVCDETPELQREKEILEKRCSKMQCRIDGMKRKHSKVIKEMLLKSNDLKSQIIEMQAQKQQQEKIHEDLQRTSQEIQRKNELLEEMHNKKQERNADMCKANLMEEATYKDLKEKLRKKQATLKEMEQRCQQLEQQNAETNDQLRTLILENELMEKHLKKKKKGWFCRLFR